MSNDTTDFTVDPDLIEEWHKATDEILAAAKDVRAAFGPPGDYGYDHKEGKALLRLYKAHNRLRKAAMEVW